MITIMKVETIDETVFTHIRCPQCKRRIGWRLNSARVHVLRPSSRARDKPETLGLTCTRCKSSYLITAQDEKLAP